MRPQKNNVIRWPSGKIREEKPEVVKAVVLAYRTREVGKDNAGNELAGHILGRLLLRHHMNEKDPGSISQDQFHAGERYAALVRRHSSMMGYALGTPQSPRFELVGNGLSTTKEPDQEYILQTRRLFNDCYRSLMDVGLSLKRGVGIARITYDICLDRMPIFNIGLPDIANLRVGLNALGRILK